MLAESGRSTGSSRTSVVSLLVDAGEAPFIPPTFAGVIAAVDANHDGKLSPTELPQLGSPQEPGVGC